MTLSKSGGVKEVDVVHKMCFYYCSYSFLGRYAVIFVILQHGSTRQP